MCLWVNEWVQFSRTTSNHGKYGLHQETTKKERLIELFEQKRPPLVLCFLVCMVTESNKYIVPPFIQWSKWVHSLFWSFWQGPHPLWKYFHSLQAREMFSSHQRSYQTVQARLSLKISLYALLWNKIRLIEVVHFWSGTETVIPGLLPVFGTWVCSIFCGLTWTRANGSSSKRLKNLGSFGPMCAHRLTPSPGISRCLWTAARLWLEDQRNWGKRTNQTSWRITLSSGSLTRKL